MKNDSYKDLPNDRDHRCFGCSPLNPHGLQMKFYTNEKAVYSRVKVPEHLCGWNNLVHGGVLSTILDEIMSWTAMYLLKRVPMTKAMNIDFIKPVYIGRDLIVRGTVLEKKSEREALIEGRIINEKEVCCAKASGTFAIFSPAVAKRLRITDDESLKWFEHIFNLT